MECLAGLNQPPHRDTSTAMASTTTVGTVETEGSTAAVRSGQAACASASTAATPAPLHSPPNTRRRRAAQATSATASGSSSSASATPDQNSPAGGTYVFLEFLSL